MWYQANNVKRMKLAWRYYNEWCVGRQRYLNGKFLNPKVNLRWWGYNHIYLYSHLQRFRRLINTLKVNIQAYKSNKHLADKWRAFYDCESKYTQLEIHAWHFGGGIMSTMIVLFLPLLIRFWYMVICNCVLYQSKLRLVKWEL